MTYKLPVFKIYIILSLFVALLTGCKPFSVSAVVEPNDAPGARGKSFDVSVNVEPDVMTVLQPSPAEADSASNTTASDVSQPVSTSTTAAEPAPTATTESKPTVATPTYPALITLTGLNVRSGPGTNYPKVGGLVEDAFVQIVGKTAGGDWWQIVYPPDSDQRAWISADAGYSQVYNGEQVAVVATPSSPQPRLVVQTDMYGANSLMLMGVTGGERQWVYYGGGSDNVYPAVSPDGKRVAFVSDRDGNQEIYVINIDGSNLTRLTYTPAPDKWPAWSPDGKRLAFDSEQDGNREIYTMNTDGSALFRVTNHWAEDGAPSWSPDGKQLVFHSNRDGNHDIYTMNADGSNLRRLTTHPGDEWTPVWSPDGREIAFMGYHDSQSAEIYVMDVDGGNLRNLTNNPAEDAVPAWSPNGRQIAFESRRNGNLDIYLMAADGRDLRRVTGSDANEGRPAWVAP